MRSKAFRRHQHTKRKKRWQKILSRRKWNYKQHKTSPYILDKIHKKEINDSLRNFESGEIY